jgi:hypothetical protein
MQESSIKLYEIGLRQIILCGLLLLQELDLALKEGLLWKVH